MKAMSHLRRIKLEIKEKLYSVQKRSNKICLIIKEEFSKNFRILFAAVTISGFHD